MIDLIRDCELLEFLSWDSSCAAAGSLLAARDVPAIAIELNARRRVINLLAVKPWSTLEAIGFKLAKTRRVTVQCSKYVTVQFSEYADACILDHCQRLSFRMVCRSVRFMYVTSMVPSRWRRAAVPQPFYQPRT